MKTPENIKSIISEYFNISVELMEAKTRKREVVIARHFAMYYIKSQTDLSLKSIGYLFGNRDHSTVIHGLTSVSDGLYCDKVFIKAKKCLDVILEISEAEKEVNEEMKPYLVYQFEFPSQNINVVKA